MDWLKRKRKRETKNQETGNLYIVGGGIAALTAAFFAIRDGDVDGRNIVIFDGAATMGGALDGYYDATRKGCVSRGGRIFSDKEYACMWGVLDCIPSSPDVGAPSIRGKIARISQETPVYTSARLIEGGGSCAIRPSNTVSSLGLSAWHKARLAALMCLAPTSAVDRYRIRDYFPASFFETTFWYLFESVFAFRQNHSLGHMRRYLFRFRAQFHHLSTMAGTLKNPENQYDEIVKPFVYFLEHQHGVSFRINTVVTDLSFSANLSLVTSIHLASGESIALGPHDKCLTTLGSMMDEAVVGWHDRVPTKPGAPTPGIAFRLWTKLAEKLPRRIIGSPSTFLNQRAESGFVSFVITCDATFIQALQVCLVVPTLGASGITTVSQSPWRITLSLYREGYFPDAPVGQRFSVFGYALNSLVSGRFVRKPTTECSGRDILCEVCAHLGKPMIALIDHAVCIPCHLPLVMSHLLPTHSGDNPPIIPPGARNYAFTGQYVNMGQDTPFTVDSSVRTSQRAIYHMYNVATKFTPF